MKILKIVEDQKTRKKFLHFKTQRRFKYELFKLLSQFHRYHAELMVQPMMELFSYLRHPSISTIFKYCREDSPSMAKSFRWITYYDEDYIGGDRDWKMVKLYSIPERLLIGLRFARAVAYLHNSPIGTVFHNDL